MHRTTKTHLQIIHSLKNLKHIYSKLSITWANGGQTK